MSARELLVCRRNEIGNARDRNRYVVLDIRALMGLRLGDEFAKAPERLGLSFTLRDRRVQNVLLLERPFEHAFDKSPRAFTRLRVRDLHHYIITEAAPEGCGAIPEMLAPDRQ